MKDDFYRRKLPHYNTSGQIYFVTWILETSVPKKAFKENAIQLEHSRNNIDFAIRTKQSPDNIQALKEQHKKLQKALNQKIEKILHNETHPEINLHKPENLNTVLKTLTFWEEKRIENIAWCIMPNHLHWVFYLKEKDTEGKAIYLQDLLHSVKLFTARNINLNENRKGKLWIKESFDTTIRNDKHLYNVINYTLDNPVKAHLATTWKHWNGNYINKNFIDFVDDQF